MKAKQLYYSLLCLIIAISVGFLFLPTDEKLIPKSNDEKEKKLLRINFDVVHYDFGNMKAKSHIDPWINLYNSKIETPYLINADSIVLPFKKVKLIIDYPIRNPLIFELTSKRTGFSRRDLVEIISSKYHEIYAAEKPIIDSIIIDNAKRAVINTDGNDGGVYGVKLHALSDLALGYIEVIKSSGGEIFLKLGMES